MIPITYDDFKSKGSARDMRVRDEIEEFEKANCEMAYVWIDENVTLGRNREIYKRVLRQQRRKNIKVVQKNKKIVLIKEQK